MNKKQIHAKVADSQTSIADAQRVRNQVFVQEKGLLGPRPATLDREMDRYDDLETTLHFVAYVDGEPVATARLIGPNLAIARAIEQPLGIDLSRRYDLSPFVTAGVSLAEVSRMCVVRKHRGTTVLYELYLAMYRESLRAGITHWVGAGNAETDALEDAEIAYRVGAAR